MASVPELNMDTVQNFAFKALGDIIAQWMGTLRTGADRLGLWQVLSAGGRVTSAAFRESAEEREGGTWGGPGRFAQLRPGSPAADAARCRAAARSGRPRPSR